jgi:hypothetical protein
MSSIKRNALELLRELSFLCLVVASVLARSFLETSDARLKTLGKTGGAEPDQALREAPQFVMDVGVIVGRTTVPDGRS